MFFSWVFFWFEAVFGLKINWDKSELILVGRVDNVVELAVEFDCRVGSFPTT